LDLPHVAHVEEPGAGADGGVLGDDPFVLHRHVPAGEVNHARAGSAVRVVERGALHLSRAVSRRVAAVTVFDSSIAIVIRPTPPGTGVIMPARSAAAAYSTSPTSLPSSVRLMPTSTTTAPGFTHAPAMWRARPIAATSTSARDTSPARSRVREWQSVTVAWR